MRKAICFASMFFLTIISACGVSPAVETNPPTETENPPILFITPQDGANLEYESLYFQVVPVAGAEGYAWTFSQNGNVLLDTIKDEQRLTGPEYRIPTLVGLNKEFTSGGLQVQVRARVDGTWTEPATITVYLPKRAVVELPADTQVPNPQSKPTPIPTQTPLQVGSSIPTPPAGWNTYINDYLGYQISYPPSMKVHAEGWISLYTDETIPPGFTFDEYFTYLENILPDQLCVWVESDAGTVTIAPPGDSIGRFVSPCPGMGIGEQYRFEDTSQTFLVNGEVLQIPGTKLYLESTGELDSEFYMFNLNNGFRITFISGPAKGQPLETYPEKMELLKQVLSTLTWIRVPDLTIPGTTCAGKYTQLLPGIWAQVAPGDPNRVRSGPSKSAEVIGQLYPGTASLVVEGPVCADGLVYWRVENATIPGGSGWTAEGDGVEYWLEPFE